VRDFEGGPTLTPLTLSVPHSAALQYSCLWGVHKVPFIGEHELYRIGVDPYPRNSDGEYTGNLATSWLGGLFTTPSSTLPFAKSTTAEATSIAEYIKYGFENKDGRQCSSIDPEHSASALALRAPVLQEGSTSRAMELKSQDPTWRVDK
jgi:hypothetical protein